jgi:hypothetical protein
METIVDILLLNISESKTAKKDFGLLMSMDSN